MTSRAKSVLEQALELTADERADVAAELLASLSSEPVPIPAWHHEILEKHLADLGRFTRNDLLLTEILNEVKKP